MVSSEVLKRGFRAFVSRLLVVVGLLCGGARERATPTVASGGTTSIITSPADGYLGSRNDEERSEMRYVMRIAEFSESSRF